MKWALILLLLLVGALTMVEVHRKSLRSKIEIEEVHGRPILHSFKAMLKTESDPELAAQQAAYDKYIERIRIACKAKKRREKKSVRRDNVIKMKGRL